MKGFKKYTADGLFLCAIQFIMAHVHNILFSVCI